MLDYIFFHETPFSLFTDFLKKNHLEPETQCEDGSYEVSIPDNISDELSEKIEEEYDRLFELNQTLMEQESEEDDIHSAGVVINLPDGSTTYANIPPRLLGRIMEVLTPEEFGDVVNAIVDAIEQPDGRPLCQRK